MNKQILKDVIEWDIVNWSRAFQFCETNSKTKQGDLTCLELGGRRGGLSLWMALNGNDVICSDLHSPEENASIIHNKYNCIDRIKYKAISAIEVPYNDHFDVVAMKSIIGGVSGNGKNELKQKVIDQAYDSLKKGGELVFLENLASSKLHQFTRKKFVKWGSDWNYLKYKEVELLLSKFESVEFHTVGFFGAFGRTERQRQILGKIDVFTDKLVPKRFRYIVFGIARK